MSEDEVPNEYRVTCRECGADGGTYDFLVNHNGPNYCPWCGTEVDGDDVRAIEASQEPTALTWEGEEI